MVVVGSGAGGGVIAAGLAEAGRSVVVLEAGPFVDERTMPTNELDAFSDVYLNHGLLSTWDGAITMLSGSGVGGGTLVNWMTSIVAVRGGPGRVGVLPRSRGRRRAPSGTGDVATIESELSVAPATVIPPKDEAILRGAAALGLGGGTDCAGTPPTAGPAGAVRSGAPVARSRVASGSTSPGRTPPAPGSCRGSGSSGS